MRCESLQLRVCRHVSCSCLIALVGVALVWVCSVLDMSLQAVLK